jgi:hypothetical protein
MKLNSAYGAKIMEQIGVNIPKIPPMYPKISKIEETFLV